MVYSVRLGRGLRVSLIALQGMIRLVPMIRGIGNGSKWIFSVTARVAALVLLSYAGTTLAAPRQAPYPISSPNPSYTIHSVNLTAHAPPGCVRLNFSVDAHGLPEDIEVWSHYPSGALDKVAADGLARWRFHPAMQDGRAVEWGPEFQEFVYDRSQAWLSQQIISLGLQVNSWTSGMVNVGGRNGVEPNSVNPSLATLIWLCRQPLSHGIAIMASRTSPSTGPASSSEDQLNALDPKITIGANLLSSALSAVSVRIRFCVDTKGRIENTIIGKHGHNNSLSKIARMAIEQTEFLPLVAGNMPQQLCGLTARVTIDDQSSNRDVKVGNINLVGYDSNDRGPQPPHFSSERPVKISLQIPPGTALPPVAKVELRFCIEKDGSVSNPVVVNADPPKYFDEAARQTVLGWRFAPPSRQICDVYQSVKFPLAQQ